MIFANEFQEMQVNLLLACDARRRAVQVQAGEGWHLEARIAGQPRCQHTAGFYQCRNVADARGTYCPQHAQHYAHTDAQGTTVLLGDKRLADAQRAADEAEGLVARICRGER